MLPPDLLLADLGATDVVFRNHQLLWQVARLKSLLQQLDFFKLFRRGEQLRLLHTVSVLLEFS